MLIIQSHEIVKFQDLHVFIQQLAMLLLKLEIISDSRIPKIVSGGHKYRFPSNIDFTRCIEEITSALI